MSGSLASRLIDHTSWCLPESISQILRDRWNELCRRAAVNGEVEQLHAARGDLWNVFDRYITVFKAHLALVETADQLNGRDSKNHEVRAKLASEIDELVDLRDEIFRDWLTLDDLAEQLVEAFPLSNEQLKAAAERFPAPQAWYDQTDDPFQPQT